MPQTAKRLARYEDLFDLPDNVIGEIVDGELQVTPRPSSPHATASIAMSYDVYGRFQRGRGGPGGWWFLDEPELHLGPDVLIPDLAGWRKERMPVVPNVPWFDLAPDWICEVLSPSTHSLDRIRKLPIYARAGVGHVWLVEPIERYLEVFRRDGENWLLVGQFQGQGLIRAEPFDAVELEMGEWWLPRVEEKGE